MLRILWLQAHQDLQVGPLQGGNLCDMSALLQKNATAANRGHDALRAVMMDISEQLRTWRAFTGIVRWLAFVAGFILLAFVAFIFCL